MSQARTERVLPRSPAVWSFDQKESKTFQSIRFETWVIKILPGLELDNYNKLIFICWVTKSIWKTWIILLLLTHDNSWSQCPLPRSDQTGVALTGQQPPDHPVSRLISTSGQSQRPQSSSESMELYLSPQAFHKGVKFVMSKFNIDFIVTLLSKIVYVNVS